VSVWHHCMCPSVPSRTTFLWALLGEHWEALVFGAT
jgi:hypothetical protein